ncbi:tyrosine-protein kinase JAK2 [Galendromus occidentalis]|uniref:non-specific protein-tyrosine kinase n=1 Tax=Galendromus occidentalis TaxID=34638 RepID=A0AAJ6QXE1_9ACAR|nr:tyrosine-protein kinase JAK2 [Galendromus occidentalis]
MAKISLDSYLPKVETFLLESTSAYSVDDLIQRACELSGITPVYRYLTTLYNLDERVFLSPHQTVGGDGRQYNLQLRIRFHPIKTELLLEDNVLDFYYYQLLDYLLNEFKLKEPNPELVSHLIGLVAVDYVKQLVENNETPSNDRSADFLQSITFPPSWNFSWWKKRVVKKFFIQNVQRCYENCKRDLRYIETAFIDGIWEVLLESRQEDFKVRVFDNETVHQADVIVGHLSYCTAEAKEGPFLRIFRDQQDDRRFPITQMCYMNIVNKNLLELNVRDEHPIYLALEENRLVELVTLIEGYYRMTGRFTAFLCPNIQPPSIVAMKKRKIHGPIKRAVAENILHEIKDHRGCFLVRQDRQLYRVYHVDILSPNGRVVSSRVIETNEGHFKLKGDSEENAFVQLTDLVNARLTPGLKLYHLAPCDYKKTGLQLCKEIPEEEAGGENDGKGLLLNRYVLARMEGTVLRSSWQQRVLKGTYRNRVVVYRILLDNSLLRSFLDKADEIVNWRCREIVPVLGLGVHPYNCLASEFIPLGSLDLYLKNSGEDLTIGDLGDAALCLAKAVWYLEEQGFVHGRIRCRSAFVVDRSENSFKVKLGEPGLQVYNEDDVPWIAPEYLSVMDSVAHAQKADLYALGTTMWEIFHQAESPFKLVSYEDAKAFFASGNRLSLAEVPQEFCPIISDCWHSDPEKRRVPKEIVRTIHQLLYQTYKPGKYNTYAQIDFSKMSTVNPAPPPLPSRSNRESIRDLRRRDSVTSQSTIASRKGWKQSKFLRLLLGKSKEYDTLSTVSSLALSQVTVDTEICDDNIFSCDNSEGNQEEKLCDVSNDETWLIQRSDIKMGELVGQGFYGTVFKAFLTRSSGEPQTVAVKRVKSAVRDGNQKDLERELDIMKQLQHPNIVEIIGLIDEGEMFLVMEFIGMGALPAYLEANKEKLSHRELIKFTRDVASAMEYLESRKIIHRDLAARNILVQSETCVKLSDFGLAHTLSDADYYTIKSMDRSLPIKWYAPESILFNKFTMKSDVWSFGVAIWEMFTFGMDPVVKYSDNPTEIGRALMDGHRLPCPDNCPPDVYLMMEQCWRSDHNLRPSFATLLATFQNMVESTG